MLKNYILRFSMVWINQSDNKRQLTITRYISCFVQIVIVNILKLDIRLFSDFKVL